ncbi:MAG TPA: hypothetical protein ENH87_16605 [Pricia antarctica]|uniref:Uncharacterized protein n=1 Tax=Pricia antarctica TaxID=641691 RepID=A0A831QTU7_9FLAO|nr:hypothetical protein [Pricia antarctica]
MDRQLSILKAKAKPSDVIYTPGYLAMDMIEWLNPAGICLDPCRGDGAFYQRLPKGRIWCEIEEGKDFFDYNMSIDWIIGNPPYSIFENFLSHSFEIAPNVAFILPTNKVFQRQKIMQMINDYGGIKGIRIYGGGQRVDFPFGFSLGVFHFSKKYYGDTKIILSPKIDRRKLWPPGKGE